VSPSPQDDPWLIAVLPGDGIGDEVASQGERVLHAAAERFGFSVDVRQADIGGAAIDAHGNPLPDETLDLCRRADAVLLGAVGGPKWSDPGAAVRPEEGLLKLRSSLGLFANLRPIRPLPALRRSSPLRPELLEGVDILFVRELTGGLYFGPRGREGTSAYDTCVYSEQEVERVARVAGRLARGRANRVTSVDKANVLDTSRLWRSTTERCFAEEFPDVDLEHRLVDAAAMQLISQPAAFDVILTENLFGDILSDEGSVLCGSLGMLPSASLGEGRRGLYEPVHGSAPDIIGTGVANPYAAILCVGLMLRHSLENEAAATAVESAVEQAVADGVLTADIAYEGSPPVGTEEAANEVLVRLAG
jgi:3-isopropylmalate dehydrogenase